jgi:hypothetical protein
MLNIIPVFLALYMKLGNDASNYMITCDATCDGGIFIFRNCKIVIQEFTVNSVESAITIISL